MKKRRINLPILSSEKGIRFTTPEMQLPRSRFFPGCRRMGWRVRKRIPHITLMICAKLVKQIDFQFADGTEGSAFIVTRITSIFSKTFLLDMFLAIIFILVLTAMVLTQWIHKDVFAPINRLNLAMQKIAEGNFDYMLESEDDNEIGELYRNYEDMRLRLKESTEEKIQNEKQNRELISNITHDLKTPITAIKGYVEGIIDGVADTPERRDKYLRTIYTKANDMDRLINELTYYSSIDNNRIPYNFHRINVAEFFADCVEDVGLDLESKNIQLNYSNLVEPTPGLSQIRSSSKKSSTISLATASNIWTKRKA